MPEWFEAVCEGCEMTAGARPYRTHSLARIARDRHNRTHHDGQRTADVRQFEASATGLVPTYSERPAYSWEKADATEAEADA